VRGIADAKAMSRTVAFMMALAACSDSRPPADQTADSGAPVTSAPVTSRLDCGAGNHVLTGNQVGAIRLGMPADSIKHVCAVRSDSTEHPEGQPTRAIRIAIGDGTLRVWANDGLVSSVRVETSHFRTADSVAVGSTLERLLRYPDLGGGYGEGNYYVFSDALSLCGLSFHLDFGASGSRPPPGRVTPQSLKPFASARVAAILVRGCRPNSQASR
jgi:hypothetical protein